LKNALVLLFLFVSIVAKAQSFCVKGEVRQSGTGELLPGANVFITETGKGIATDAKGFFSLCFDKVGTYSISVSFIGFSSEQFSLALQADTSIVILLKPISNEVEEVVVTHDRSQKILSIAQPGVVSLNMNSVTALPAFLGESDPIKAVRLMPGVQAGGEGNSGLFVRGGDPGQNLVLLEDMPIYNVSHLLGLYSVFNPSLLKGVTLYKGAYPALWGGRASSLLRIGLLDGIPEKTTVEGSIGLISSRVSINTPITSKSSVLIGYRQTYLEALRPLFGLANPDENYLERNMYNFNDLNARFEVHATSRSKFIWNGYYGKDKFDLLKSSSGIESGMNWGNWASTLKYIYTVNPQWAVTSTVGTSAYFFNLDAKYQLYSLNIESRLADWFVRADVSYSTAKHFLQMGGETVLHTNTPESTSITLDGADYNSLLDFRSREFTLFLNDTYQLNDKVTLTSGVRATIYSPLGPYSRYHKDFSGYVTDTTYHAYNKPIKTYWGIEPRVSLNYKFSDRQSYKASISRCYQYIHLISVGSVSFPTDIWFPSTALVKPEYTDQIALGYYQTMRSNAYEASVDLYFRHQNNAIEFMNSLMSNYQYNEFEESIVQGDGYSFGTEWHVRKKEGAFTGWLSYTLSWTLRQFDEINSGKVYYGKYDRRHDFAVTASYQINAKWSVSSTFIYSTGNAVTLPSGRYVIQGSIVNDFTSVNSYRMPPYHRLDLSLSYKTVVRRKYESSWNFSVYNAYNRANPYYIYFSAKADFENYELEVKPNKESLLPIIPSISWSFKF